MLEISVLMAQYPSRAIAKNSFDYRTLGLGYANLGALLMSMGIPYDSDSGRGICGALTALLNARLIPQLKQLIEAVRALLAAFGWHKYDQDMRRHVAASGK